MVEFSPRHTRVITVEITQKERESPQVVSLYLRPIEGELPPPKPGQFFMVWVPNYEEIPMSASGFEDGVVRISVARVGSTTTRLHEMRIGDRLGLKGPLGNGLDVEPKKYLLVGGGYGVAPLIYTMRKIREIGGQADIIIGARTGNLLIFVDEAKEYGNVYISTDDGSMGYKGTALDLMKLIIKDEKYDEIAVCGPKPLLLGSAKLCVEARIPCKIFAEAHMKCGIGLCGSCVLGKSGLLVCRDGPIFDAGIYYRAFNYSNSK